MAPFQIYAVFYYHHAYRISRPIRRTIIFSLGILEKNNDECILILVIYWKKTGLLHTKISNHNLFIIETQKIVVTATKITFIVVFTIKKLRCCIIDLRVFISLEIILTLGA